MFILRDVHREVFAWEYFKNLYYVKLKTSLDMVDTMLVLRHFTVMQEKFNLANDSRELLISPNENIYIMI